MSGAPLLVDLSHQCDAHTDATLEFIFKAIGDDPPGDSIWDEHPNPHIRRLVELFTQRGLDRSAGMEAELRRWISGDMHRPELRRPPRPPGVMARWAPAELELAQLYLQSLPVDLFTLDDWMLLVEYIAQRYLPPDDLRTEAEWLASRANMMGRVQAVLPDLPEEEANTVVVSLPSIEEATAQFGMSAEQRAVIDFGRARCAEYVRGISEAVRGQLRRIIVDYQEAVFLGDRARAAESLETRLLDTFGALNRDWRRIAVTEATENLNQGFVAAQPRGTKLRRVEQYRGACGWCRSIDKKVVTVVDPAKPDKDGDAEVWVGKTNVGRSASPRKRMNGELVEREPHERFWIAAGSQHPHCRGSWVRVVEGVSSDPEFEAWLNDLGKRGRSR